MRSSLFHLKSRGSTACLLSLVSLNVLGVLTAAPTSAAPIAAAQQKYKAYDLGNDLQDLATNDSGQVVGQALNGLNSYAFFLPGTSGPRQNLTPLLPIGTTYSGALDINNFGHIVGYFRAPSTNGELHAFSIAKGVGRDLNNSLPTGTTASVATAVNNWGQITGYASMGKDPLIGNVDHAFVLSNGTATDIHGSMPRLYGYAATSSRGEAINNIGQVAGTFRARGTSGFVDDHAFFYNGSTGEAINLEALLPTTTVSSAADAINDAGQVVGTFLVSSATSRYESHAFLYSSDSGVMQDLDDLLPDGFSNSFATAVNNKGQILINADRLEGGIIRTHAFLLSYGVLQDLNDLMPNNGLTASYATDLSNSGQIVGIGSQSQRYAAFLMTPRGANTSPLLPKLRPALY